MLCYSDAEYGQFGIVAKASIATVRKQHRVSAQLLAGRSECGGAGCHQWLLGAEVEGPADQGPKSADAAADLLVHWTTQGMNDTCTCGKNLCK